MNENENLLQTKEFKLLFNLLEKAEQILSIINLSDSSISKYNTLKKLTFEQLNIDFKPLEKRYIKSHTSPPFSNNQNNNDENIQNIKDDSLYISHFINIKKSLLIDLMMNYISNIINQEQNLNFYLNSLTEIYNLSPDIITKKTTKDIITDINIEESKMAELFTKIDQIFVQNFENTEKIENNCEKNLKNDDYFLETTLNLIDENYEKYKLNDKNKNLNFNSIAYKDGKIDENILKLEFVKKVFDEYFNKNKNNFNNNNVVDNNELFNDVCDSLPEIIKENDTFHKNFKDLINYISNNIEGKII
jgi:hypothetical protein